MTYFARSLAAVRTLAAEIARDLRDIARSGPRTLDEAAAVAAVLLSIACAHALGEQNVGWAAFSAYMVMRSDISLSLQRGLLRPDAAEERQHRCRVHDRAFRLGELRTRERACAHRAGEIDRDNRLEGGNVVLRAAAHDAGAVDEHVEPGHVADHARHRRVVADIRSDGAMTRGRALLLVSSGDSHRSAERRERVGNPGADPRRPADDERRLAGEEIFAKCGIGH